MNWLADSGLLKIKIGIYPSYGANSYTYDCENQLTCVVTPDFNVAYTYDAFGRRETKTVDDSQTVTTAKYVYSGFQVIAEYDGSDNL